MKSKKTGFNSIDDYVATFPEEIQRILEELRGTIKAAAPDVEETISYQMPTFNLNGRYLVYFAAWKDHIGFYPPPPKAFKKEVSSYEGPKLDFVQWVTG